MLIYDNDEVKRPKDFGHDCEGVCNVQPDIISTNENTIEIDSNNNNSDETKAKELIYEHEFTGSLLSEIKENEPQEISTPTTKSENSNLGCTADCTLPTNDAMIMCNSCKGWTHYKCTKLPIYQVYLLVSTSRRYTCEKCVNIPNDFKKEWNSINPTTQKSVETRIPQAASEKVPETIQVSQVTELFNKLEENITTNITNIHKSTYEREITQLRADLISEREKSESFSIEIVSLSRSNAALKETSKLSGTITDINSKLDEINTRHGAIKTVIGLMNEQFSDTTEVVKRIVNDLETQARTQEKNIITPATGGKTFNQQHASTMTTEITNH